MSLRVRFVLFAMLLMLAAIVPIGWYAMTAIDRSMSAWHDAQVGQALQQALMAVDDPDVRGQLHDALVRYQQLGAFQRPVQRTTLAVGLGIALVTVLLAMLVALILAAQLTRPLRSVSSAARQIAVAGDLDHTVPRSGIDEISELVDSFNNMVVGLRESREALALAERRAAWQDIARAIAHEIKNPLTPMRLTTQRLRERFTDNRTRFEDSFMRSTEIILTEIDRLERLANGFSNFAKIPAPNMRPLDLRTVIDRIGGLLGTDEDRRLTVDVGASPAPIMGDREQLEQAVLNLVKNGLEAVDPDTGHVDVRLRVEGKRVLVAVEDDGPGISPEVADRVFDPYVSTKIDGTGIGLAVVARVITDHHGTVTSRNVEPTGVRFEVILPLNIETETNDTAEGTGHARTHR